MAKLDGKILIIDDDPEVLLSLQLFLKRHFSLVQTARQPDQLTQLLKKEDFDVILLDMNFSPGATDGAEGIRWLNKALELAPGAQIIMITAYGHIEMAVKAIKEGATDFISKPWQNDKLLTTVKTTFQLSQSRKEVQKLSSQQAILHRDADKPFSEIIGRSAKIQEVFATIQKVAKTDANVLILGENGTGKELVARAIHRQSQRAKHVFINVDLGAIAESLFESELFGHKKGAFTGAFEDRIGRFEAAQGGTLFLDEIGNLSLALQAKLLSALQSRRIHRLGANKAIEVNIRLICATNMPIHSHVKSQEFRQDLLYRINTVEITLPPLRERIEDLPLLTTHFLQNYSRKYQKKGIRLAANTLKKLQKYPWPGNIRELQHALERATILSEGRVLQPEDFSFQLNEKNIDDSHESLRLDEIEKHTIKKALTRHKGNISKTALELGITRAALYRRMEKHGL